MWLDRKWCCTASSSGVKAMLVGEASSICQNRERRASVDSTTAVCKVVTDW